MHREPHHKVLTAISGETYCAQPVMSVTSHVQMRLTRPQTPLERCPTITAVMVFYYHPRLVCAPSLAHTRRVLRFPGRSFPEHHAFSLRPSAAPASEFHGAHHGHAAQVSQVAQPAYLFHETRPFSQLVHLLSNPFRRIARLMGNTEPLSRKTTRRSDCIPVSPSLTRWRPSKPRRTFITCAPPRARSSCPTVPLSELPDPHLRMVEDFVSLARPLATALWPCPSPPPHLPYVATGRSIFIKEVFGPIGGLSPCG